MQGLDLVPTPGNIKALFKTPRSAHMSSKANSTGLDPMQGQFTHVHDQLNDSSCGGSGSGSSSGESFSAKPDRPFACPLPDCGRQFQRKFTLHEHIKTHTGAKPFQCQVKWCGKRFKTSGNMSRHRRLHTLKQFQCPAPDCLRIFTRQEKLTLHYRVHLGSGAFPCEVAGCSKAFSTSGNLTRHMRRHHQGIAHPVSLTADSARSPSVRVVGADLAHILRNDVQESGKLSAEEHTWQPRVAASGASLDAVSDQDLVELLECLFDVDSLEASTVSLVNAVGAPHHDGRTSHHFEEYSF